MSGPLDGFRVIDLTTMISGPLATMTLTDQSAGVIKIEHPEGGDLSRQVTGRRGGVSARTLVADPGWHRLAGEPLLRHPRGHAARDGVGHDVEH